MNIEEGKSIQDGIPTPDNPVEIKSINLFDSAEVQINEFVSYHNNNGEQIIGVEIRQETLDLFKKNGIYGFSDGFRKRIPIIINNFMAINEVRFIREKINKPTEYEPFGTIKE